MLPNFAFESFKHIIKEHDTLVDFVDTCLEKVTNGESRGAWNYVIEIEADDVIIISYVDRWDDEERIRLTWDELVDDSGEKFRARQAEERRLESERHEKAIRDAELRQLEQARETVARLEAKHAYK